MSIDVRLSEPGELRAYFDAVNLSFGEHPTEEQWALDQLTLEADRVHAAFEGKRVVGGGGAFSFSMTVPGEREIGCGGVTMVGVLPTHRRQGILRSVMAQQLADIKRRGEPIAALWASEGSIYQRFGYGLATLNGTVEVARDRATFRSPFEPSGTFELLSADDARPAILEVYDRVRAETPGFYRRHERWWDVLLSDPEFRRHGASKRFNVVHRRDGRPVGYLLYRIRDDWQPAGPANRLVILEMLGVDPDAIRQLWRYAFGVDLMGTIFARLGPADHPLMLLAAEPRRLQFRVGDGMWVRIVDVPAALAGRGYAADGSIVLDVADPFMPDVAGRWRLTVDGVTGRVEPTTDAADIAMDVADLAAVYLGGFRFASLGRASRTTELTPGARMRADAMFASPVPAWCPEVF